METSQPMIQFRTNRNLLTFILLSLITFGIYGIVVYCHISEETNVIISRHDGKHTMHYLLMAFVFSWLTLGIAPFIWYHRISNRQGEELQRRGIMYSFSATDFWLWSVLGSLIIVGPYIYIHKQLTAMNLINEDFNLNG